VVGETDALRLSREAGVILAPPGGSSSRTAIVTLLVTQTDKSRPAGSAQQQSQPRRQVRATDDGAVSYRASDEPEYSGLPWRP
jgi:hypothetical protein